MQEKLFIFCSRYNRNYVENYLNAAAYYIRFKFKKN